MTQAVIQVTELCKVYQTEEVKVRALRGVDLEIRGGDFVAIMGASGSGKSTMMNILGCLDRPTSGSYRLTGQEVGKLGRNQLADIRNNKIGFVFQGFNLLRRTSALDNVQLPLLYSAKISARERRARAAELLERFGLGQRKDHFPSQLSGGQQQRVAVARALVNRPRILLADEPTGNLDSRTGLEILAEFQRLNVEQGQTIVMVTHDRDIANCCARQIVFQDGQIVGDYETPTVRDAAAELESGERPPAAAPWEFVS